MDNYEIINSRIAALRDTTQNYSVSPSMLATILQNIVDTLHADILTAPGGDGGITPAQLQAIADAYALAFEAKQVSGENSSMLVYLRSSLSSEATARQDTDEELRYNLSRSNREIELINVKLEDFFQGGYPSEIATIYSTVEAVRLELFVKMWKEACNGCGGYDSNNKAYPFYLNGVQLTYNDAVLVYLYGNILGQDATNRFYRYADNRLKTNLPRLSDFSSSVYNYSFYECSSLKVANVSKAELVNTFYKCGNLERIVGSIYNINKQANDRSFEGCTALTTIENARIGSNNSFSLKDCALLDFDSLQYMLAHAANTAPLTITLHPAVFERISDESNEWWHSLLNDAKNANITLATV